MATTTVRPFEPAPRRKSFGLFNRSASGTPKPAVQYTKLVSKQRPVSFAAGGKVETGTIIRAQTLVEGKTYSTIDLDRPLPPRPTVTTRPLSGSAPSKYVEPSSPGTSTMSTSTAASSIDDEKYGVIAIARPAQVILHAGEVVSTGGLLRSLRRREYLVLTETQLLRFRSQTKAAEIFPA